VPDPYYGDVEDFAAMFDLIESACRALLVHLAGSGPADVSWDLRDREGARVRAGFYWAQLRTPDGNFSRAVVVR
jgi:hypothetical protein